MLSSGYRRYICQVYIPSPNFLLHYSHHLIFAKRYFTNGPCMLILFPWQVRVLVSAILPTLKSLCFCFHFLRLTNEGKCCFVQRSQNRLHHCCAYRNCSLGRAVSVSIELTGLWAVIGLFVRSLSVKGDWKSKSWGPNWYASEVSPPPLLNTLNSNALNICSVGILSFFFLMFDTRF